jgi:hypothetical protein
MRGRRTARFDSLEVVPKSRLRAPAHPTPQPVSSGEDRARVARARDEIKDFGLPGRLATRRALTNVLTDAESLDRLARDTEGSE